MEMDKRDELKDEEKRKEAHNTPDNLYRVYTGTYFKIKYHAQ